MTRLCWTDRNGRLYGRVSGRHRVIDRVLLDVLWDDGRRGVFVEGAEPTELTTARQEAS